MCDDTGRLIKHQLNYTLNATKNIFDALKNAYMEKIYVKQATSKFTPSRDRLHLDINGIKNIIPYVSTPFSKLTTKTTVTLKIRNGVKVFVIFYHSGETELIRKCVRRIYCMINVFGSDEHLGAYNDAVFNIVLFSAPRFITKECTNHPSEMDEIGKRLYFNCTCGYAMIDGDKFKVCVTRKNGCLGLLVHELGHICHLDLSEYIGGTYAFPDKKFPKWKTIVKSEFDVMDGCNIGNLTEGINNGNSSIVHAMFLALEDTTKDNDSFEMYGHYYMREFAHSIAMVGRLLRWFKYKTLSEFISVNKRKYIQSSLLLEYIVARCVYLLHFDKLGIINTNGNVKVRNEVEYFDKFMKEFRMSSNVVDSVIKIGTNKEKTNMEYYYNI